MGGKKNKKSEDKEMVEAKAKLAQAERDFEADKAELKRVQDEVRARGGIQLTAAQAETAEKKVKECEERVKSIEASMNKRKVAAGM